MCFLSVDFRLQMLMERSLLAIVSLSMNQSIFYTIYHLLSWIFKFQGLSKGYLYNFSWFDSSLLARLFLNFLIFSVIFNF